MKIKINRNSLWTETFVRELSALGVKYACISPGSRNTPLTLAFAQNKQIKSFVHIDERSGAFFALGLAKGSSTPVALVCTSGTAVAEFYPAIIEAYQQRIPLIICTADRPPELIDVGANQTINQNNIYRNHIRWFFDVGLPEPIARRIKHIKSIARRAYSESFLISRGPVHLNFPFRKPFEPESYTDEISEDIIRLAEYVNGNKKDLFKEDEQDFHSSKWFLEILSHLKKEEKGIIVAGPENYNSSFHNTVYELSEYLGYPILADGASQLRFGNGNKVNVISNYEAFLRSEFFTKEHSPKVILQFGRTVTSKALDEYLEKQSAVRFMINDFGDWFDPSNKAAAALACKPYIFCLKMIEEIRKSSSPRKDSKWLNDFISADISSRKVKRKIIESSSFPNESRVIKEILNAVPQNVQIMISNSMPIRDFDYFASKCEKEITVFNNRGASGIDGITSTALGIASSSETPTLLLTGDLSFYYDINGILAAKKYKIPLTVVLINNNGGGIFEVLPISDYGNIFNQYFIAPHDLDFAPIIKAFGGKYHLAKSWESFSEKLKSSFNQNSFSVLEVRTDAKKSLAVRKKYWLKVDSELRSS